MGADLREIEQEIASRYSFDRKEFGKIVLIASASMLVVSAHAALVFTEAESEVDNVNQEFTEVEAMMDTEGFNDSLEALNSLQTTSVGTRFAKIATAFNRLGDSFTSLEETDQNLSRNAEMYRWLVLVSILGLATGGALMRI